MKNEEQNMSISAAEGELTALFRALCHFICAPSLDKFFLLFTWVWSDVSFSAHFTSEFYTNVCATSPSFCFFKAEKTGVDDIFIEHILLDSVWFSLTPINNRQLSRQ